MLGLLGCCGPSRMRAGGNMVVVSDRYHPAMAAHRVGAAIKLIDVKHNMTSTKLQGACQMISKYDADGIRRLNSVAWDALREEVACTSS